MDMQFFFQNYDQSIQERYNELKEDTDEELPQKRKNSYQKQPDSPSERFKKTLPGAVISKLREKGSMTVLDLTEYLNTIYRSLRTASGSKYQGFDISRSLRGLLSMGVFESKGGIWSLKEPESTIYENKKLEELKNTSQRKKKDKSLPSLLRPTARKLERQAFLLEKFSKQLRKDKDYSRALQLPFNVRTT